MKVRGFPQLPPLKLATERSRPERLAFIGLGTMGTPMAANLVRKGFQVIVHNRTRSKEEPLAEMGASRAASPAEAAEGAEIVILIVSDTPDVDEILFGPSGVADAASPGTIVIDMSTIDPEAARKFATRLARKKIRMIDAPVSGGTEGAQAGTLSIMAGGDAEDIARVRPVLEGMGSQITHVGPVGSGQMAKAINQVIVGGTLLAVAEGMVLGMKAGVDMDRVLEAIQAGAAGSWALANRASRMIAGEFPLGFKLTLHRKDLAIALSTAAQLGVELPGAALVASLEDYLVSKSLGNNDVSVLVRAIEHRLHERGL